MKSKEPDRDIQGEIRHFEVSPSPLSPDIWERVERGIVSMCSLPYDVALQIDADDNYESALLANWGYDTVALMNI